MNISDAYKTLAALAGTVVISIGALNYFQTKAEAQQQAQQSQRSVEQLRAELLLNRINELNTKKAKEGLTPAEETELQLNIEQVKSIQAKK